MEALEQLKLLSDGMEMEADGEQGCDPIIGGKRLADIPVSYAQMPNGRQIKLLKTMITSACERNCFYCPFRAGRDMRRASFQPEDLADLFHRLYKARIVEGIFLSSGIIGGGVRTQDKLIATAEILRKKYQYRGYLHLKIMPGTEYDQVYQAMLYASRVSVNLEAPNDARLERLAPLKEFSHELVQPLLWAEKIRQAQSPVKTWNGRWPSSVTQFVVGAAGESDLELLSTSEKLYRQGRLSRVYYSRFNPVPDTPFENLPAENPKREFRLYQSSFLLRDYGYTLEEMPFQPDGCLPLDVDPKLAWAQKNLANAPVEVNRADREALLRVPGIGPRLVTLILRERRQGKIRSLEKLKKLGVVVAQAAPFILLDGHRPAYQEKFL